MRSDGAAAPGADLSGPGAAPAGRGRGYGLGTTIVVFCATLTAFTVTVAFVVLGVTVRAQTRRLLADVIAAQQRMIVAIQSRAQADLLRTSTLLTDSPTLRAAMETYRVEADTIGARTDLLGTIQREAEKVAAHLGNDLLLILDDRGRVLAAAGDGTIGPAIDEDLSSHEPIRRALNPASPADAGNFAVVDLGGRPFAVGAAPIVLRGFVIGALALGDRLDREFVLALQRDFNCEVVLESEHRVLAASLDLPADAGEALLSQAGHGGRGAERLVRLGEESYVTAPLVLGGDGSGRPVTLYLLHSIDRALARSNRALLWSVLVCALIAIALSGLVGVIVSRSLLRPLERLVHFVRDVARRNDYTLRYESPEGGHEVRTLVETYNQLIESLRRHEAELVRRSREELTRIERLKESEKLAALGRMLSGAAHEINNPLTGVVGNIEILLARSWTEAEARRRLETVRREGRRIVALVRNLLKVSRRDTGERAAIDLNEVVREALALQRHDFATAAIAVDLRLEPDPIPIDGSALELQQVFLNLLGNARDALGERKGGARLTIRSGRDGPAAEVVVQDNGPGLKEPERVFEHFYTTKPVGKGTGLGLSISRSIVENHGGEILAANRPEGGARFTIRLPGPGAGRRDAPAAAGRRAVESMPARTLPASVLLVDDEPAVLDLQLAILDSVGAVATAAATAEEARRLLERRDFDLIVSDLKLPGELSGEELYRWVAANRPAAAGRFIFVTGDVLADDAFPVSEKVRVIPKPFSMDDYVSALRESLHALSPAA